MGSCRGEDDIFVHPSQCIGSNEEGTARRGRKAAVRRAITGVMAAKFAGMAAAAKNGISTV